MGHLYEVAWCQADSSDVHGWIQRRLQEGAKVAYRGFVLENLRLSWGDSVRAEVGRERWRHEGDGWTDAMKGVKKNGRGGGKWAVASGVLLLVGAGEGAEASRFADL